MQSNIEKNRTKYSKQDYLERKNNLLTWEEYWNLRKEKTNFQKSLPVEKLLEEVGYYEN